MLVLAAALFAALVRFHPRFNEVPLRQYFQITDNKALPSREPRVSIWYAALENPRDYSLYGKGVGQCADYLVKQYERHDWPVHIERRFHSHNQYLCTWIEFGFLAMLLFIALWLTVPFVFKGNAQIFAVFFTETLMLNMLTENMLSGIEGIFFTATGMLILLVLTYRAPASPS
jgi:O-antigen ligase